MMKTCFAIAVVLALSTTACKKGDGGGDADCAASINKGVDSMAAARMPTKDVNPEMKAKLDDFNTKMKGVFIAHCTADKWPATVVKCFETITGRPDVMKCQGMLPKDQADAVRGDVRDLMVSSGLRGPGHGHDGSGGGNTVTMGSAAPAPVAPPAGSATGSATGSAN